jgi:ABC-type Mn2+/Zn2+ transport system permease subunit
MAMKLRARMSRGGILFFYAMLCMVITVAARAIDVVTVLSFLIITATTSALYAKGWSLIIFIALIATIIATSGGLISVCFFNFSIGPIMALFLGIVLAVAALLAKFVRPSHITLLNQERLVIT